jgi:hypothetical protein
MRVHDYSLFPTRLLSVEFADVEGLNEELFELFLTSPKLRDGFDMHPDALNLLQMADRYPAIGRLRGMFLEGVRLWLLAERIQGELSVDVVLFSNFAKKGEHTLVHNHSADLVGVYYVRTPPSDRPAVFVPGPDNDYDYFAPEDGALVLHDPRFNANLAAVQVRDFAKVYPTPGLLVVFPGYLWHSVTPVLSEGRRLAISANFHINWPAAARPTERWPVKVP